MRLIKDADSPTGMSAAILLRGVRPNRLERFGAYQIALSEFDANFTLNVDGFKVRPRVSVVIQCHLTEKQKKSILRQKLYERAIAGSPMLT